MERSFKQEVELLKLGEGQTFGSDITCLRQVSLH